MKKLRKSKVLFGVCLSAAFFAVVCGTFLIFQPQRSKRESLRPVHRESSESASESTTSKKISEPVSPSETPSKAEGEKESSPKTESPKEKTPQVLPKPLEGKVAYLTFDDGPTPHTPEVLQILREKGVTATFFTVYQPNSDFYYQQIVDSGCELALHAWNHDYKTLYASIESYFDDFNRMQGFLQKFTGSPVTDFRFPGGSSQTVTDKATFCRIILETQKRGLRYFDWNVSAEDATTAPISPETVYQNIIPAAFQYDRPVILMHERSPQTRAALPKIIDALKERGYRFDLVKNLPGEVQHRTPAYANKFLAG